MTMVLDFGGIFEVGTTVSTSSLFLDLIRLRYTIVGANFLLREIKPQYDCDQSKSPKIWSQWIGFVAQNGIYSN